jgi:hypothetical protein
MSKQDFVQIQYKYACTGIKLLWDMQMAHIMRFDCIGYFTFVAAGFLVTTGFFAMAGFSGWLWRRFFLAFEAATAAVLRWLVVAAEDILGGCESSSAGFKNSKDNLGNKILLGFLQCMQYIKNIIKIYHNIKKQYHIFNVLIVQF